MSSEIEGAGLIVAAVALPVAAAFGAGWLAWQAGKLLIDANAAVDRGIQEKQRQLREAEEQRKLTAQAGCQQLKAMCSGVLAELEADGSYPAEAAELRWQIEQLDGGSSSEDTVSIESRNQAGLALLERVVSRRERLRSVKAEGLYSGMSVADLMDDLRLAAAAAEISETRGQNVCAADPAVLERVKLNRRLSEVSAQVMTALEFVADLAENYGLSQANNAWFQSCFNGVDGRIRALCAPSVSNAAMKKGIQSLEEMRSQYDMLYPSLEQEKQKLSALYPVYAGAARALGEPVRRLKHFKSASALEEALGRLERRAQRAKECAEIYQKLGPAAYMCYAWDEELRAMGYTVHTRKQIKEMIHFRPERARLGEAEMPFYQWSEGAATQLYRIAPECDLQLIVHPDGSITMQTIAVQEAKGQVVEAQKHHCSAIRAIHERLRENWFILYNSEETAPAESVCSVEAWLSARDNVWAQQAAESRETAGVRENVRKTEEKVMHR